MSKPCCICQKNLPSSYPCDRCPTCPGWSFVPSDQKCDFTILLDIDYGDSKPGRAGRECDCGMVYKTRVSRRIPYCRFCRIPETGKELDPFGKGFLAARRRLERHYPSPVPNRKDQEKWVSYDEAKPTSMAQLLDEVKKIETTSDLFLRSFGHLKADPRYYNILWIRNKVIPALRAALSVSLYDVRGYVVPQKKDRHKFKEIQSCVSRIRNVGDLLCLPPKEIVPLRREELSTLLKLRRLACDAWVILTSVIL
jgi:hypothetical protein